MNSPTAWRFCRFGLVVTGHGEQSGLERLFRELMANGHCSFEVIKRISQRSPSTNPQKVTRHGRNVPSRDERSYGFDVMRYVRTSGNHFCIVIDDLEDHPLEEKFDRYRDAFNCIPEVDRRRTAVFFLVTMLEAYFWADVDAVNDVLSSTLSPHSVDVETIRNPKSKLKRAAYHYDEKEHAPEILKKLNLRSVLANCDHCASLRTMIAWCTKANGEPFGEDYCLSTGKLCPVTCKQLDHLD